MANTKFRGINGTVESPEVAADFEKAERFDNVWIGDLGVYYKNGFKVNYIAYPELERVFIRIQEVNGKLCCGNTIFQYFRLVFVVNAEEYGDVLTQTEGLYDKVLPVIAKKAPSVAIGFVPKA